MKRRVFIACIGGAAAWPLLARVQEQTVPVIGFFHGNKAGGDAGAVDGTMKPASLRPALMLGLASSLSHPGANVTGVIFRGQHAGGRVKLLSEFAPQAKTTAYLRTGPAYSNAVTEEQTTQVAAAAQCLGRQLLEFKVDSKADIDAAFTTLISKKADALDIAAHPFFDDDETIGPIAALSLEHKIPVIFIERALPAAGGLMSYGESCSEGFRHAGGLVARTPRARSPAIYRSMGPRRLN